MASIYYELPILSYQKIFFPGHDSKTVFRFQLQCGESDLVKERRAVDIVYPDLVRLWQCLLRDPHREADGSMSQIRRL